MNINWRKVIIFTVLIIAGICMVAWAWAAVAAFAPSMAHHPAPVAASPPAPQLPTPQLAVHNTPTPTV